VGTASTRPTYSGDLRREIEATWPELTYHYGLSFDELAAMPRWLRMIYVRGLPRILARQQLAALEAAIYPNLKPNARDRMHRRLARQANGGRAAAERAVDKPRSAEEMRQKLAQVGIGVEIQEPVKAGA
jgi:hypothetical protein